MLVELTYVVAIARHRNFRKAGLELGISASGLSHALCDAIGKPLVAQRLSADTRWVVAGAPSYFDRFDTPIVPADLATHRCLGVRLGNDRIYD